MSFDCCAGPKVLNLKVGGGLMDWRARGQCREELKRASARLGSCSTSHWHFEAASKLKCDRPGDGRVSLEQLVNKRCANIRYL